MKRINNEKPLSVSITPSSILLLVGIILGLAFIYYLTSVVVTVFVAVVLASIIHPVANKLKEYHIPKAVTVIGVYFILFAALMGFAALLLPALATEMNLLVTQYGPTIDSLTIDYPIVGEITSGNFFKQDAESIFQQLQDLKILDLFNNSANSVLSFLSSVFGNVLSFFGVLVLALYFIIEPPRMNEKDAKKLLPAHWNAFMHEIVPKVQSQTGAWLRGQLLIMFIVFVVAYILLSALGVPYALILAILAGLLEVIPFLGPNLAAIPAIIVAATVSWPIALGTAIGYFAIQQLENNILTPTVYKKIAGVNPVVSIVAILIGLELGVLIGGNVVTSVIGGALALPFTVIASVFIKEWLIWRSSKK